MSTGDTRQQRAQTATAHAARPFGIWTALSYHALLLTPEMFRERIPPAAGEGDRLTPQRVLAIVRNPLAAALIAALITTSLALLWHNGIFELRLEDFP
jgi:hypothetical protein